MSELANKLGKDDDYSVREFVSGPNAAYVSLLAESIEGLVILERNLEFDKDKSISGPITPEKTYAPNMVGLKLLEELIKANSKMFPKCAVIYDRSFPEEAQSSYEKIVADSFGVAILNQVGSDFK